MANPYKKAEQVQKKAPGSRQETIKHEPIMPIVMQEIKEEKVNQQEEKAPVAPVIEKEPAVDLFEGMEEQKPKAKSYGFYLDDEVVAALDKLAKQKKISKSKVLNTILRNALIK